MGAILAAYRQYVTTAPTSVMSAYMDEMPCTTEDDPRLTTTLFGVFSLSRGIGNILSTPISTALQSNNGTSMVQVRPGGAYQGQYENVILYAGTCFTAAAIVVGLGWFMTGTTASDRSGTRNTAR